MAYSKLVKVCRDYALGYQDINQAIDNNDAMRVMYDAKHGTAETSTNPWDIAGRHDDVLIARGVLRAKVTSASSGTPYLNYVLAGSCISSSIRYGTGQWGITLYGLSAYYAVAQVESSSTTVRKAQAFFLVPASGSTDVAQIVVSTYELVTGGFTAADLDFDLYIWGTPL